MSLEPLPQPGLAVVPRFVSSKPESFKIKSEAFSTDCEIKTMDGKAFLFVEAEFMSLSKRKTIRDAATGQQLCQIRRDGLGGGSYYAETEGNRALFEIQKESMGTSRWTISFPNANDGGKPERLEYESDSHWSPKDGTVSWRGRPVARMEKPGAFSKSWVVTVAPGLDPLIVLGLQLAIMAQRRASRSGAAAGAGGGA